MLRPKKKFSIQNTTQHNTAPPDGSTVIYEICVWFVLRINKSHMKETTLKTNQQYTYFICNATF